MPRLARIVVDEADRRVAELGVLQHLAGDHLPALAGADDQDLAAARQAVAAQRLLDDRAHREARAGDQQQRQEKVDRDDPPRQRQPRRIEDVRADDQQQAGQRDGLDDAAEVVRVGEAPPLLVGAEQRENRDLADDGVRQHGRHQLFVARRNAVVEAQIKGSVERDRHQHDVDDDLLHAVQQSRATHPAHGPAGFTGAGID